jgi:NADH:ubiquinone oxidoreductase subunit 3 (subunit A)
MVYVFISFLLTIVLFIVGFILSPKNVSFEKTSSYECGFEPFGDAHSIFNIQFFVVGILFMLFDLELAYLFPWVLCLSTISLFSFFLMLFFLILLVIGFIYE